MKYLKKVVLFIVFLLEFSSTNTFAATPSAAGELGLHKLQRLISLKKISPSFESQSISLIVSSNATGFAVTIMQGLSQIGDMNMLNMTTNKDAAVLTYVEVKGGAPISSLVLPGKSAVTLLELGLHCVQGELIAGSTACKDNINARLYDEHFQQADLIPVLDINRQVTSVNIVIKGDGLAKTLTVSLNNDGTLISVLEK